MTHTSADMASRVMQHKTHLHERRCGCSRLLDPQQFQQRQAVAKHTAGSAARWHTGLAATAQLTSAAGKTAALSQRHGRHQQVAAAAELVGEAVASRTKCSSSTACVQQTIERHQHHQQQLASSMRFPNAHQMHCYISYWHTCPSISCSRLYLPVPE